MDSACWAGNSWQLARPEPPLAILTCQPQPGPSPAPAAAARLFPDEAPSEAAHHGLSRSSVVVPHTSLSHPGSGLQPSLQAHQGTLIVQVTDKRLRPEGGPCGFASPRAGSLMGVHQGGHGVALLSCTGQAPHTSPLPSAPPRRPSTGSCWVRGSLCSQGRTPAMPG